MTGLLQTLLVLLVLALVMLVLTRKLGNGD